MRNKLSRSDIRKFLYKTINKQRLNEGTINIAGISIVFDDSGILIGDKKFSLTAITLFGEYPITIKSIITKDDGLVIAGSTSIKDVEKPLSPDKIEQIKKEVKANKAKFVIAGKLADIKFTKIG